MVQIEYLDYPDYNEVLAAFFSFLSSDYPQPFLLCSGSTLIHTVLLLFVLTQNLLLGQTFEDKLHNRIIITS
jgi:hypothetical protein